MRKKLGSIILSILLICSLTTGALAADPLAMTDIEGHWAQACITDLMNRGLLEGMSATTFEPERSMNRAMFVTVLGRIAGINPEDYRSDYLDNLYTDVTADQWFAPYVNWATRYGIVLGIGDGTFAPAAAVTREQMAALVVRFASVYNYELTAVEGNYADYFTDADQVSEYAREPVEALRQTGIINGFPGADGTYYYGPLTTSSRAQCAAVLSRLVDSLEPYEGRETVDPAEFSLAETAASMKIGQTMPMIATILPENTSNQTLTWVSMNPGVAKVDRNGTVTALSEGTAEIRGYTWNGLSASCTVTVTRNVSLAYAGETYEEKCLRIYGQVVDDYRTYYDSEASNYELATNHLVSVPVQVWDFTDSTYTSKYTKTIYLQVHENIADTVQAIFEEIYNGDEQFPISSAGGYYQSTLSEHHPGLAIDINPIQNCECNNDGTVTAGEYWKPGEDPYSIPPDGDVVQAFKKYGFGWGGDWRSKKDYMHFSYFGT